MGLPFAVFAAKSKDSMFRMALRFVKSAAAAWLVQLLPCSLKCAPIIYLFILAEGGLFSFAYPLHGLLSLNLQIEYRRQTGLFFLPKA